MTKRMKRPSRRSVEGPAPIWAKPVQEVPRMARGKHSSAATHRRMTEAQERVRELEKSLRAEERAHIVTKRIAERAQGLEAQCHELRADLALATSDEMRSLQELVESKNEKIRAIEASMRRSRGYASICINEIARVLQVDRDNAFQYVLSKVPPGQRESLLGPDLARDPTWLPTSIFANKKLTMNAAKKLAAARGMLWDYEFAQREEVLKDALAQEPGR